MNIALFLDKISHDHSFMLDDEFSATGWIHGMAKPSPEGAPLPIQKLMDGPSRDERLPHLALRKETWGAFLVHGPSASVYQLDHAACALFERLKAGETMEDIASKPEPFTRDELALFSKLIGDFDLLSANRGM